MRGQVRDAHVETKNGKEITSKLVASTAACRNTVHPSLSRHLIMPSINTTTHTNYVHATF